MFLMCRLFFNRRKLNMGFLVFFVWLTFLNNTSILANDITEFEVLGEDGVFYINASVVLYAPAEYVYGVLTDYVHIYRLNPSIIENEILTSPDDNVARVRTKVIACVVFHCEEIERVEDVRILANGDIQAVIVPEFSQFKSGITRWKIRSMDEYSVLTYSAEMEPDFFIPPVIGNAIVKARLRDELTISFTHLERIANILSERDWNTDRVFTNWTDTKNIKPRDPGGINK